ncbi:MAG: carboxypeptidase-like regulatory domain-containing protein [Terriglobales bacterium]
MKRLTKLVLGGTILGAVAFALMPRSHAGTVDPEPITQKDKENQQKSLTGNVVSSDDAPLPQSVVYLKNMKTLAVKSFIADDAGNFRFFALSPNTDYQVYAEYNGQRSGTKTVSGFDSKTKVEMTLKVDIKK